MAIKRTTGFLYMESLCLFLKAEGKKRVGRKTSKDELGELHEDKNSYCFILSCKPQYLGQCMEGRNCLITICEWIHE